MHSLGRGTSDTATGRNQRVTPPSPGLVRVKSSSCSTTPRRAPGKELREGN